LPRPAEGDGSTDTLVATDVTLSARMRLRAQTIGEAADRIVPYIAPAILAAAALVALWTRLTVLEQSLWGDEVIDIVRYGLHGPGTIWSSGAYIQGDPRVTVLAVLVVTAILALGRFMHWSTVYGATPYESARPSAQLVTAQLGPPGPIFTNFLTFGFTYYLDQKPRPRFDNPRSLEGAALAHALCSTPGPFTYVDTTHHPAPQPACLRARLAFEFAFPQHRPGEQIVWLVP
jgi:hypothetical protein